MLIALMLMSYQLAAQSEISTYDESAGTIRIPNVVLKDKLFTSIDLRDDGNGRFDIVAA